MNTTNIPLPDPASLSRHIEALKAELSEKRRVLAIVVSLKRAERRQQDREQTGRELAKGVSRE